MPSDRHKLNLDFPLGHSVGSAINLIYLAQLHAEYNRQKDIYLAHRVVQAWELAHFIQCVSLGLTREVGWGQGLRGGQGLTHGAEAG